MPHNIIQNGGVTNASNNNYSGIIKRNKYAVSPIMEENPNNVGGAGAQAAIRLPKISGGLSRSNQEGGAHQQSQAMLPPISGGQGAIPSVNGQGLLS